MVTTNRVAIAMSVTLLLLLCGAASGQIPLTMNYQVMLTDDADQPLADDTVVLVFRLYEQETGGGQVWSETHSVSTNGIGVASVVLGSINPLDILFGGPMWLQVEVDGEAMEPRRPLSAAPYAHFTRIAEYAVNSDHLGAVPAESYALDDDLWQPGTLNDPTNPLEWTKLKSVPAGFADGVDDAGGGDGHSLDAYDGDPVDVVFVNYDGDVLIGWNGGVTLSGTGPRNQSAAIFRTASPGAANPSVVAVGDSCSALAATGGTDGLFYTPTAHTGVAGFGVGSAEGGAFYGTESGHGAYCTSWGDGSALWAEAVGGGFSGHFAGGTGVLVERSSGIPALMVEHLAVAGWGDAAYFYSGSGLSSATWTMNSVCHEGIAGRFQKQVDDGDVYAVTVLGASSSSEGLYVDGTILSTGSTARAIETPRGPVPVFGVSSPDVDVVASGTGRLTDGAARIDFDDVFSESITGATHLRVTATPVGGWSAIYVVRKDALGFDLRSESGEMNAEFDWVAVGRARGHETRPAVTLLDPNEEARIAEEKAAEMEARRPPRDVRPEVIRCNMP